MPDIVSKLLHRVLVDFAILHNQIEILAGVANEIYFLQRIAVDQDQVGQRAFLDDAEFAGVGITETG